MSGAIDPYYQWLGIPKSEQPPNHYRLLGLQLFEENTTVIANSADRQMGFVQSNKSGAHTEQAQRLLTEFAAARLCLLTPAKKSAYDAQLRATLPPRAPAASAPPAIAPPASASSVSASGLLPPVVSPSSILPPPILPLVASPAASSVAPPTAKPVRQAVPTLTAVVGPSPTAPRFDPARANAAPKPQAAGGSYDSTIAIAVGSIVGVMAVGVLVFFVFGSPRSKPSESIARTVAAASARPNDSTSVTKVAPASEATAAATSPNALDGTQTRLGEWVDLLEWSEGVDWQPRGIDWHDNIDGAASRDGVTLKARPANHFPLPAVIDGDYDLEVEFTRRVGAESVGVHLPVGYHNLHLEFSAFAGKFAGVNSIAGVKAMHDNPTTRRPSQITNNERHKVAVRVRRTGEQVSLNVDLDDLRDYIMWDGADWLLTQNAGWKPTTIRRLWLAAWQSEVVFHVCRIRMLSGTIERDFIDEAAKAADWRQGFMRLVHEPMREASAGWSDVVVNQTPREFDSWDVERSWPLVAKEFRLCDDYYGAHAPSNVKIEVPPRVKSFSVVAYNDSSRDARFRVLIDGRQAYESGTVALAKIRLDIPPDSSTLELVSDGWGSNFYDRTYWCYPRFYDTPAATIDDERLDDAPGGLKCRLEQLTVGHGTLTHNRPLADDLRSEPVHFADLTECHEFVFAHAPASITYDVPAGMTRFTAVGYNVREQTTTFCVYVGDELLYESPAAGITPINVKLPANTQSLTLKIKSLGQPHRLWTFWCYPRLHRE